MSPSKKNKLFIMEFETLFETLPPDKIFVSFEHWGLI